MVKENSICDLCEKGLGDGSSSPSPVIQIVEDRHPLYDREVQVETYHKECFEKYSRGIECDACGSKFRLIFFERGGGFKTQTWNLHCPFCGAIASAMCQLGLERLEE